MTQSASEADIVVRPAGAFELDLLAELHACCFAEAWDADALAALLAMPGAFALLADLRGKQGDRPQAAGFILVRAIAGEAEILALGVQPAARRRGIARRLLTAGSAEAASRGTARIYLEVAADNLAARTLYRAVGFAQIARRAAYYRGPEGAASALVMARDIAPEATGSRPPDQTEQKV
jgi:ribosomal protein S18 acetylase RimI-like enzyme